jgi:protein-disulfide reductase (glutathione)
MNRRAFAFGACACAGAAALTLTGAIRPIAALAASKTLDWNEREIRWHSYEDGLREAQRSGKPILAVFYADWCPHCRATTALFRDEEIVRLSRGLVMVKINSDRDPEINARYSPDGSYIPRIMVLRPNGQLVSKLGGSDPRYRYFLSYDSTRELAVVMKGAASLRAPESGERRPFTPSPIRF